MKWIGQHIWDFISRFRSTVYLEDLDTSSEQNVLVVDSDGKVTKNTTLGGDDLTITNAVNNRVVTSSGGTVLNAESGLTVSGTTTTVDGLVDLKLTGNLNGLGYNPDVINYAHGLLSFTPYQVFGTGVAPLIEVRDHTGGGATGAPLGVKAGGGYGSNAAGGTIHLIAGRGTGSAAGGGLAFWSSTGGVGSSSATTYNTSGYRFYVDNAGNITSYGSFKFAVVDDGITFEGGTHDTTLKGTTTPSAARTITLPDASGTVALTSDIPTVPRSIMVCRHPSDTMFYMWRRDQWHTADSSTQVHWGTGSTPNTTLTGAILASQVSMPLVVAISNMQIYKVVMNWKWGSKQPGVAGNRPFEFSFHTSTPPNDSQAEQTLSSALTVTNNNGNYKSDYQYITTWDINSGSGITLSAGDALNMFARCTHTVTTIAASTLGSIYIEYKYV